MLNYEKIGNLRGICMQNLYSCLTALLGQPENGSTYAEFLANLDEQPKLLRNREHHRVYYFSNSGVSLSANENGFFSVFLHFNTVGTKSATTKPFIGELPYGICASDTKQIVEYKIGKKPNKSRLIPGRTSEEPEDYWDDYECGAFILLFIFCSDGTGIGGMSVSLRK